MRKRFIGIGLVAIMATVLAGAGLAQVVNIVYLPFVVVPPAATTPATATATTGQGTTIPTATGTTTATAVATSTTTGVATGTATSQPSATGTATATTAATATNAPTATPQVSGICATNAPAPADNGQAWVTNPTPPQNSDQTVCARLLVNGVPQQGVGVTITVNYRTTETTYTGVTNAQGIAPITFGIGRPSVGFTVIVDVAFAMGQTAQTSFTPQ